jgi:hypothetical protein
MRFKQSAIVFLLMFGAFGARGQTTAPSFRNEVQPILTRLGCNAGACHGAAAGKNGFRLSLRGYDDEGDYRAITRNSVGRRIVPEDPANSLFLLKPTGVLPHKGGTRIVVGSPEYRVLAEWIASGTPGPREDDARIETIEILPKHAITKPGDEQQLRVVAHFNNGVAQDVTRWAKYTANDTSVATVDDDGKVKIVGRGEAPVTAWYLSRISTATLTAPYEGKNAPEIFSQAKRRNFIDELVLAKLADLNLAPSPRASDGEFIRRAFIDTIGVLPTADEVRGFLADASTGKRDALIEALLARPEFVDYWSYKWSDLLLVNSQKLRPAAMSAYYNWIRRQVAANTPWDQFARQIVTATGSTLENGAANFYVLHDDATKRAETVSVAFMGMSINCAKCHNHPMEKWTNAQYYANANIFARVRTKNAAADGDFVVFNATEGDLVQPLTGKAQAPQPLDGKVMAMISPEDRRVSLADWLVAPENPYFTRAIVNRVWANFLGVGLVEAVDDMRKTNPASNEALLAALSDELARQRYDLKGLMRVILQSETYQRSSQATAQNVTDRRFYSHYYARRMMAEVMLDALSQVTGSPTAFKDYPPGTRALELPDSNVESYFLRSFGRPDRINTCECERASLPSMAQALHVANGETVNSKLQGKGNRIEGLLASNAPDEKVVEEAYLSGLARYPTAEEKSALLDALTQAKVNRREAIEDLYWSVLSSKGFQFNH